MAGCLNVGNDELDEMMCSGPLNFTLFQNMFREKLEGNLHFIFKSLFTNLEFQCWFIFLLLSRNTLTYVFAILFNPS